MSPQIKLTYFDAAGRAELSRLLFALGGIDFEDDRLDMMAFGALQETFPLGQLPLLTVAGAVYPQSMAMARYAGRLSGLYPADALECLKIDSVSESLLDGFNAMVDIKWLTPDETIYSLIETMVAGEYVLGGKLSLADVQLFDFSTNSLAAFPDFQVSAYPKIQAIVEAVKVHPKIASYLASRQ